MLSQINLKFVVAQCAFGSSLIVGFALLGHDLHLYHMCMVRSLQIALLVCSYKQKQIQPRLGMNILHWTEVEHRIGYNGCIRSWNSISAVYYH